MSGGTKPVVVGLDGSTAGPAVLRWAVREATARSVPLLIAHAVVGLDFARAAEIVRAGVLRARDLAPDLPVSSVVDDTRPAGRALCHLARDATLVVVGGRRTGGLAGLLPGSASAHVAAHAAVPVLIVRGGYEPPVDASLPVTVGVGPHGAGPPEPQPDPVLGFAFDEARLRGTHLVAVRTWVPPSAPWRLDDVTDLATTQCLDLAQALLPWRQSHPDVSVRQRVIPAGTAAALVDAGADAQLVVVGSRRTPAANLRLGSVSRQVLHHAPCDVAVVTSAPRRAPTGRPGSAGHRRVIASPR